MKARPVSTLPWIAVVLVVFVLVPSLVSAQESSPQELFGETLDVRVVNLDVVVEQKGERVFGLHSDDFVLKVDGKTVPIEFFSEVRGGTGVAPSGSTGGAVPALEPDRPVPTRYLVFVDDLFTLKNYRNRVLRNLREDLPELGPEDRMAIVAYDGEKVEMLTTWSGSRADLKSALREAEERPAYGLRYRSQQRFDDEFARLSGRRTLAGSPYAYAEGRRAGRTASDVREVVAAASSTLRAFAQPEGRKVMILLSGNWPDIGLSGPFNGFVDYSGYSRGRIFSPLVDTANLLGYTLYPVDVAKPETSQVDASYGNIREARFAQEVDREREWRTEGNLVNLADRTGGRALLDGAAIAVLPKIKEDTRSYYSIGFTPDWRADNQRNRVEVEVPGLKRAKIRLRDSYSDLSARTESTLRLESAQLFDLPIPSAGSLTVRVLTPENAGWRKVVLPLQVEIPLDRLTRLPTASGWAGRVELRVAVTDDRGDRADIPVIPLAFQGTDAPEPGEVGTYVAKLKMRERPHRLLVSVLDPASGEELTTRLEVDPSELR